MTEGKVGTRLAGYFCPAMGKFMPWEAEKTMDGANDIISNRTINNG